MRRRQPENTAAVRGLILAGGSGSRLYPLTRSLSKHLLPVDDRPMVYFPLSLLMMAGLRDIVLTVTPEHLAAFQTLLGDGSAWGIRLSYAVQTQPLGLAHALHTAAEQCGGGSFCMLLGDNLFDEAVLPPLQAACARPHGATVFARRVADPRPFGVLAWDETGAVCGIEEKPEQPPSDWALTGLYVYDSRAAAFAGSLQASPRGEYEISDLNRRYLQAQSLHAHRLPESLCWLDMGTPHNLRLASAVARRRPLWGCPEAAAFRQGWLSSEELAQQARRMPDCRYAAVLRHLAAGTFTAFRQPETLSLSL